jgi:hypothetical protein
MSADDAKTLSTTMLLAALKKAPKHRLLSVLACLLERDGAVAVRPFLEGYFLTREQCDAIVAKERTEVSDG